MSINELMLLIATGLLGGVIAGSLGVGGGIIIVPSLVFIFGMSQHLAQGTSLAVLLFPVGLFAVINYHKEGYINYKFAIILMVAFLLGSYFGSKMAINLPAKTLKKMFGVLMMLAGVKMVLGK